MKYARCKSIKKERAILYRCLLKKGHKGKHKTYKNIQPKQIFEWE